ncbi:MAG: LysE/ArgO family amino acid transporter [Rhizobiaceae bacterium]|jgi:L-lysine exporter family protein LysE/ArgO|nr:LysE/ArgO family amino acid transporter [Rhizobiaceae bacterium]
MLADTPLLAGFLLGGSLIIAIGAQNAFILRQGLMKSHVFILCFTCALSDALLIAAGVGGLGTLIDGHPEFVRWVTYAGAAFLFAYALFALRRAWKPQALQAAASGQGSLKAAMAQCLAFTFLNPHVYLDTVVLVGGISSRYLGGDKLLFAAGAMAASFVWFFSLGYGARLLQPVFAKPVAWRVLDLIIAAVMTLIGVSLLRGV